MYQKSKDNYFRRNIKDITAMKNKAQFQTFIPFLVIGIIVVIVFAIVAIPMAFVTDEVIDDLSKSENFGNSSAANSSMQTVKGLTTTAFDQMIFILLFAIIIGVIVLAIFSDFHPVLISVIILVIVILVIIGGLLGNFYDDFTDDPIISDKADEFTLTNVILGSQFPIIILIIGVIVLIVLMAKRGGVVSPV